MPTTTAAHVLLVSGLEKIAVDPELARQYGDLIERYRSELLNQALVILGNLEDAEDVVQETFCEALRDGKALAQAQSVGALLRSINRANALDRVRGKRRDLKKSDRKQKLDPGRHATTGGFSMIEIRDMVAGAIDALPANLRAVVVLHYWEHLSCDEIAGKLKVSPRTVRRLLYEASAGQLYGKLKGFVEQAPQQPAADEPTEP